MLCCRENGRFSQECACFPVCAVSFEYLGNVLPVAPGEPNSPERPRYGLTFQGSEQVHASAVTTRPEFCLATDILSYVIHACLDFLDYSTLHSFGTNRQRCVRGEAKPGRGSTERCISSEYLN